MLRLRLEIISHVSSELHHWWSVLLYCDMRYYFTKIYEVGIQQRQTEQGQKQFFISWANKNRSSRYYSSIILDRYPSSHGGILLVESMSFVLLFLSKVSYVFPSFWQVLYNTKITLLLLLYHVFCIYQFLLYHQFP